MRPWKSIILREAFRWPHIFPITPLSVYITKIYHRLQKILRKGYLQSEIFSFFFLFSLLITQEKTKFMCTIVRNVESERVQKNRFMNMIYFMCQFNPPCNLYHRKELDILHKFNLNVIKNISVLKDTNVMKMNFSYSLACWFFEIIVLV